MNARGRKHSGSLTKIRGMKQDRDQPAARLAAIVESSDDAIISKDLNGYVTSWNAAAERMFGYTAGEIIGRHITTIIPAARRAEEDYVLSRIRAGIRIEHFETVRCRNDGTLIEVSLTVSPIRAGDGTIIGASKIARDIGDRRLTERDAQRLAAIVASSDDAIVSKDLNSTILTWNAAAEEIFGYSAEEAIGQPHRHDHSRRPVGRRGRGDGSDPRRPRRAALRDRAPPQGRDAARHLTDGVADPGSIPAPSSGHRRSPGTSRRRRRCGGRRPKSAARRTSSSQRSRTSCGRR